MNFKKVTVKTEEAIIKRTVKTTEIDFDFTQVYDCMYSLSFSLKSPVSFQILFYLLKSISSDNLISVTSNLIDNFNKEKEAHGFKKITEQTFYNCMKELTNAKILTRITRGSYFINPYVLWKDDKEKRIEFIKEETSSPNGLMYNPKENMSYLNEPDKVYAINAPK